MFKNKVLDIQSKEVLKSALKNYEGTFIVVSHDREFLDNLTNRIWDIENKALKIHHFGVKDFLKRKMESHPYLWQLPWAKMWRDSARHWCRK